MEIDVIDITGFFVSGDDMKGRGEISVRDRNAIVRGNRDRRGDAGDDLKGDAVLGQELQFLSASSEKEGISPLQADHPVPLLRFFQNQLIHFPLRHGVVAGPFSDIDGARGVGNHGKHTGTYEAVVQHHICILKDFFSLDCEQALVSGAGSYEPYFTFLHFLIPYLSCDCVFPYLRFSWICVLVGSVVERSENKQTNYYTG